MSPDRARSRRLVFVPCSFLEAVVVKPQVRIDPTSSLGTVENLREQLEDQLTSALQAAVDKVDEKYHGEDVEDVTEELVETTKAGLHSDIADGFEPDDAQIHSVAAKIVDDNT
jgi:hypothetical protein